MALRPNRWQCVGGLALLLSVVGSASAEARIRARNLTDLHISVRPWWQHPDLNWSSRWRSPDTRVLVHCTQSSGCSYFMAMLSQSLDIAAAIDTAVVSRGVPDKVDSVLLRHPNTTTAAAKVVIWGKSVKNSVARLESLKADFRPHVSILFIRHPADNFNSLQKHLKNKRTGRPGYARQQGEPVDKLRALEALFERRNDLFDITVFYGDLFTSRGDLVQQLHDAGVKAVTECNFCMKSSMNDLIGFSKTQLSFGPTWGNGGVHDLSPAASYVKGRRDGQSLAVARDACPKTLAWCEEREADADAQGNADERTGSDFVAWCKRGATCKAEKPQLGTMVEWKKKKRQGAGNRRTSANATRRSGR